MLQNTRKLVLCVFFCCAFVGFSGFWPTNSLAALFIRGDLTHDGTVDIFDFNEFVDYFGETAENGEIEADLNKDGEVDIFDFNIFVEQFGKKKQGEFQPKKNNLNFCVNVNLLNIKEATYTNPEFLRQVKELNPAYIRIPGGTVNDYWSWQRGGLLDRESLREIIDHSNPDFRYTSKRYEIKYITIPKVAAFLHALDIPPIFVVNMTSSSLQKEIAYLKEFEQLDIPVRYIELGNEFYIPRSRNKLWHPTAEQYKQMAATWSQQLQAAFPNAEISYVAARVKNPSDDESKVWNQAVKNIQLNNASVHLYGASRRIGALDANCGMLKGCVKDRPDITTEQFDTYLAGPFYDLATIDPLTADSLGGNKDLWITEHNVGELTTASAGIWAHGLFVLNQSLSLFSNEDIEMACVHSLTANTHWALIWNPDFEYSAAGHTISYLGKAMKGAEQIRLINIPNTNIKTVEINGESFSYPQQYGYQFIDGDGKSKFLIVNLAANGNAINISHLFGSGQLRQIYQEPGKAVFQEIDINEKHNRQADGRIYLRPYSVTLVW